ncbi:hypothetical protein HDU76_010176, partial [Blyttiomyces sp. JEL0837]
PNVTIGASEGSAQSFCYGSISTSGCKPLSPQSAILSAHFLRATTYIQVTGTFDPSQLQIPADDNGELGGQYDDAGFGVEPFSGCEGYSRYLELVEPALGVFCLRCCKYAEGLNRDYDVTAPCNAQFDFDGCFNNIPGDYGSGFSSTTQPDEPPRHMAPPPSVQSPNVARPKAGAAVVKVSTVTVKPVSKPISKQKQFNKVDTTNNFVQQNHNQNDKQYQYLAQVDSGNVFWKSLVGRVGHAAVGSIRDFFADAARKSYVNSASTRENMVQGLRQGKAGDVSGNDRVLVGLMSSDDCGAGVAVSGGGLTAGVGILQ